MFVLDLATSKMAIIILAICMVPIFALMIYAITIALRRSRKQSLERDKEIGESVDDSQVVLFLDVYGGEENILEVNREISRITVKVKDVEAVKLEDLKELGANGILVMGNQIKASFGDRSIYIYNTLIRGTSKNE